MEEKKKNLKEVKAPKKRKDKYEEKVSFNGTFDDLLNLTIQPRKEDKESGKK